MTTTPTDPRPADSPDWHLLDPSDAAAILGVDPRRGVDTERVAPMLARHGRNELEERAGKGPLALLWEQFTATLVLILLAAAGLSGLLGKAVEATAILAIVVLFALLGFFQEYRAERAIAALKRMSTPLVRVRRDGNLASVPSPELVPGDVVLLEAGTVVPADLRLIQSAALRIQEAALTGESEPVDKTTAALPSRSVPLGDRVNMAYLGTSVTYGRGEGMVVATGMHTELGKVASLLHDVTAERTPLQRRLDKVGRTLAVFGIGVAALVGAIGLLGGESIDDVVLTAISTMVAVVPEGLPAVVTFTLALGSQRMLRRNALIRRLPAVETLGSVTVICTDKTGTLTENRMTVTTLDVAGHRFTVDELVVHGRVIEDSAVPAPETVLPTIRLALTAGALCNDASIAIRPEDGAQVTTGDPTEAALVVAALRGGVDVDTERERFPRLAELPFDSDRKRMTTVHTLPEPGWCGFDTPAVAFVKGAVDGLVEQSSGVWLEGAVVPMDAGWMERIQRANEDLASTGVRVLGIATRGLEGPEELEEAERDLVFLGMVGIIDPPRPEVAVAVARCFEAGIRPVMITGDHPATALAIARELGIALDGVLTGAEVGRMDREELAAAADTVSVFARVSPEHKLRIVEAFSHRGEVVAMTGDGVNDAPALKQADIGVAMGITGTDVSKEAADMVLRDDNFATIVSAVEEGRVIYDNLRRFVGFAVAGNIGKVLVMLVWPLALLLIGRPLIDPVALQPLQLLWLNLMTDGLLGLSLGAEPAEEDVMQRRPVDPGAGVFAGGLGAHTVVTGLLIGTIALGVGIGYHAFGPEGRWQTMVFTSLAVLQVFQAFAVRSHRSSLRSSHLLGNRVMNLVILAVLGLQAAAVYAPALSGTFLDLQPLSAVDWAVTAAAGVVFVAASEAVKSYRRRRGGGRRSSMDGAAAGTGG